MSLEEYNIKRNVSRCRSCDAEIVWLPTQTGARMPVDRERLDGGDAAEDVDEYEFDPARHRSHFATCPNAAQHRRRPR